MLYHQTKDVLYVKEFLGHKSINSTLMYVQIAKVLFGPSANDEFIYKVAETPEEVCELSLRTYRGWFQLGNRPGRQEVLWEEKIEG